MPSVEVKPVKTAGQRTAFVKLPWRLYDGHPTWVAPLLMEAKAHVDPKKNPFFQHAQVQLFLAYRGRRVVGRISAHIDHNLNAFQDNRWGLFGFFDIEDDPEVATALLDTAADWLRVRGRDRMVGPMDFTTNDECGVLVSGFDLPPTILTQWHHPYVSQRLEGAGLAKAMDLNMWDLHVQDKAAVHPAIWKMAADVKDKHGILCRPFQKKDLDAEVGRFLEVYNAAWERNWGFVPLTEAEVRLYAKTLKPVLDENWAMIAERMDTGETVGAALTLPDYNQVLTKMNGRLLPTGWLTFLRNRKKTDRVRVFALGVKPEYQHTGVAARFYEMHYESAASTPQHGGETGWILETNKAMNRAMQGMGGSITRTYRVYERML